LSELLLTKLLTYLLAKVQLQVRSRRLTCNTFVGNTLSYVFEVDICGEISHSWLTQRIIQLVFTESLSIITTVKYGYMG